MKQTFNIPDGCKTVTVEQIGNQLITSFEPEKYVPKVGDLVKNISEINSSEFSIYVFKEFDERGDAVNFGDYIHQKGVQSDKGQISFDSEFSIFEKLTPEEFQAEFDKLGYVYDFETHTAHKKRWRAEEDGEYYFINGSFEIQKIKERYAVRDESEKRFSIGNYHITLRKAEQYRDFMLKKSLEFHTNNK